MSYYPILSAPYCTGQTTLYNFAPNNWEQYKQSDKHISLTYLKENLWHSIGLEVLEYGHSKIVSHQDIIKQLPENTLPLLSLSDTPLPQTSTQLPTPIIDKPIVPNHRATLALHSDLSKTSYQGEINPFPPKASLLTFSPFLQFGEEVKNYVLLLNIEKQASSRKVKVEIYSADDKILKNTQTAYSNNITTVSLDNLGFNEKTLPIVVCKTMTAIPLYFSCANQGEFLSLEHTHPPASLVVHGNRFGVQRSLKDYWFSQLKNDE